MGRELRWDEQNLQAWIYNVINCASARIHIKKVWLEKETTISSGLRSLRKFYRG